MWTVNKEAANLDEQVRRALLGAEPAGAPPWGKLETLGDRIALEATMLCSDGKSHYVVVAEARDGLRRR